MTDLEIVDYVEKFLLKQGKKAIGSYSGMCQYKTDDGLKCAVGCLIPEEAYTWKLEGASLRDEASPNYDTLIRVLSECGLTNLELLQKLQYIHDEMEVSDWKWGLKTLREQLDETCAEFEDRIFELSLCER